MGKFQSLIITICLAFKIITTHGLELCQSQIGYEYFIQGIMENTLPNTELGHVDIGGDITQIEIVQKAHAFFSFNNITRNVTLIKELNTDQDAEDIKPLILTCRKVQEASSVCHI